MIFPFMSIYLSNYFGLKITGVMLLINVVLGIVLSFFGGYFSDHFGRKRVMMLGEGLRFMAFVVMMICNSPWFNSPFITFLMMTVNTICWALTGPASMALLIDYTTMEDRKYVFSITYWANNLSIAVGSSLGGFLFQKYLFELMIVLSLASLLTISLINFFINDKNVVVNLQSNNPLKHIKSMFQNYREVFRDKIFILYNLALILIMSMEFQLNNYVGIRLESELVEQKLLFWTVDGIKVAGLLRTVNTVVVVLLALFAVKLVTHFKERKVIVLSSLVFVTGYAIISYSNTTQILFVAMLIASMGEVMRVPVEQSYMASLPPKDKRSSYLAVNGMTYNISNLICSFTVMISAYLNSFHTSIMISIIGYLGILILFLITPKLDQRILVEKQYEEGVQLEA
jgi:DHA1 family multidrug resistance protein B-like MFS transporter